MDDPTTIPDPTGAASTPTLEQAAPTLTPGIRTTEFWSHALVVAGLVLAAAAGALPPQWAAVCATASGVAYAVSRGLAKGAHFN